jgi:hypothetical protein
VEWESYPVPPPGKKDTEIAVLLPASKHTKIFVHEQPMLGKKLSMKRKDTEFFVVKSEFFLLFSILIFPYVLGFLLCYILFYFYGGMTIESFLEMQQLHLQIEFWCISAYLFVTTGVIWFVFKSLVSFFKKEYS